MLGFVGLLVGENVTRTSKVGWPVTEKNGSGDPTFNGLN